MLQDNSLSFFTERLHFKEPLEVSHQISRDICMQIQEEATHWSSGI